MLQFARVKHIYYIMASLTLVSHLFFNLYKESGLHTSMQD